MKYWTDITVLLLSIITAACRPSQREPTVVSESPHVFVIVIDTLRRDKLGTYGQRPSFSPNIDRFAQNALVFQRAYAQSSWTKTSVASLLTGLHPYRHQVFKESQRSRLPSSATTIAERLKTKGYRNVAVSMNPHFTKHSGFRQGFAKFTNQKRWRPVRNEFATSSVIRQLRNASPKHPHFVYLHYLDPHDPWTRQDACDRFIRWSRKGIANQFVLEGRAFNLSGESLIHNVRSAKQSPVPVSLNPVERQHLRNLYHCEIAMVDAALGRLLIYLDKHHWLKNALVIITADHGEEFWEHGMMRHGYQMYNETVSVPLIVKLPPSASVGPDNTSRVVQLTDIPATIYDLVGINIQAHDIDGTSLLTNRAHREKGHKAFGMTQFRNQHQVYLIENDQKVIHDINKGSCEHYDLATDTAEKHGLPCNETPIGRSMFATLQSMKRGQSENALEQDAIEDTIPEKDEVLEKQLKELGYVQ